MIGAERPARARALALLCSVCLLPSGCSAGTRLLSSPAEYGAFRVTRAGYTVEDRLAGADRYLDAYPKGRFADEVRARFDREEQAFYDSHQTSIDGLDWYLHVLPAGPHAAQASMRRAELAAEERQRRGDSLVAQGRVTERRLARAARSRQAVVDAFGTWIGSLAADDAWGRPTWAQPGAVIEAMRLGPDPGACDDLGCKRVQSIAFQIPVAGGGLDERAATFDLGLELRRGGVWRASIRGPELFSRAWEAARGKALPADKLEARAEAVGYAVDLVSGAFEGVAPADRCNRGITPPVILRRACDGWLVEVTVGDTPADDDIVLIEGPQPR
jgi:hypothetical protein